MADVTMQSLHIECSLFDHGICSTLSTVWFHHAANWLRSSQTWFEYKLSFTKFYFVSAVQALFEEDKRI